MLCTNVRNSAFVNVTFVVECKSKKIVGYFNRWLYGTVAVFTLDWVGVNHFSSFSSLPPACSMGLLSPLTWLLMKSPQTDNWNMEEYEDRISVRKWYIASRSQTERNEAHLGKIRDELQISSTCGIDEWIASDHICVWNGKIWLSSLQ